MEIQRRYSPKKSFEIKLSISLSAIETIENEALKSSFTETGGVIAGIGGINQGEIVLTHASESGPRAVASRYSFQHDSQYCQAFLDSLARRTNGKIDYLGEWHKHFERDPKPSSLDVRTMAKIANNSDYHVSTPLLLIIGISNLRFDLRGFFINRKSKCFPIAWEVIDNAFLSQ